MAGNDNSPNGKPDIKFCEDGKRVWVDSYGREFKFYPAEKVTLIPHDTQAEGPYLVQGITDDGKYVLCDEQGRTAKDGQAFEETKLRKYDPFA